MNDKTPMSPTERSNKRNSELRPFAEALGLGSPSTILTTMHSAYKRGAVVVVEIYEKGAPVPVRYVANAEAYSRRTQSIASQPTAPAPVDGEGGEG